jgi:hypothetical protein
MCMRQDLACHKEVFTPILCLQKKMRSAFIQRC